MYMKLSKSPRHMDFQQIKEKFEKLGCEVIKFSTKEISEEFEKDFGREILQEMFGLGYEIDNKNIIQINISKLNKTSCSSTLKKGRIIP